MQAVHVLRTSQLMLLTYQEKLQLDKAQQHLLLQQAVAARLQTPQTQPACVAVCAVCAAGDLLAIENFAYTAHALSLPAIASLGDFATAARQFCSRPWPQTLMAHGQQPEQQQYLWRYCFGSAFAWTLLHEVLRISEGQQLHFTNALVREDGAELGLDWALGAAVLQLANNSAAEGGRLEQQRHVQQALLFAAVAATALLTAATAGTLQAAWRSGWLSQPPVWLTVMSSGGSSAAGGGGAGKASPAAGSWSSMASSAWANAASRGNVKAGYNLVPQQLRF